ncbi:protein DUF4105 [Candidatus Termititenax dinenymphae]|uniref:Protein DUF4105 n=1 Tax=Candidatus Termititenax dinenymphae TaxID=2218523 RepID=A0A388TLB3_9BACT|nr:protein DUF4105 [Candidatus Termititenax dinenymphae]
MLKKILLFLMVSLTVLSADDYAYSREWLNLLYYEKSILGYKSPAMEDGFFVTAQGRTDPQAEYAESLRLVLENDRQFKTKFPLRYKYIARYNNLKYEPVVQANTDVKRVFLAYPSRYMRNSASMFGHLFLLLETDSGILDSQILHFVGDSGDSTGFDFAWKGLTGKFEGRFIQEPYYTKIQEYNFLESREILFYTIKLSPEQIENLQLHYLEMQNTFFWYYYINKNCAFFIGRFLDVVLDSDVIDVPLYLIPAQATEKFREADLLADERLVPSITKVFDQWYSDLNLVQKGQVQATLFYPEDNSAIIQDEELFSIVEYMLRSNKESANLLSESDLYDQLQQFHLPEMWLYLPATENIKKLYTQSAGLWGSTEYNWGGFFNLVHFSDYEQFNELEINTIRLGGLSVEKLADRTLRYDLDLAEINNILQFNMIFPTWSWSARSMFSYHENWSTNQEAYTGHAFNLRNWGLLYGMIGINYANYDTLGKRELDRLDLFSGLKLGWRRNITKNLKLRVAYEHKYNTDYQSAELIYKYYDLLGKLTCLNSHDDTIYQIGLECLF